MKVLTEQLRNSLLSLIVDDHIERPIQSALQPASVPKWLLQTQSRERGADPAWREQSSQANRDWPIRSQLHMRSPPC